MVILTSIVTVFHSFIVYKTSNILKSVINVKWHSLTRKNGKTRILQVIMDKIKMYKVFLFISDEYGLLCEFSFPSYIVSVIWMVLASCLTGSCGNSISRLLLWQIAVLTKILKTCVFEFPV